MREFDIDQAKWLINDFCEREFGSSADFSDLTLVPIAYTTITDNELECQIYVDLEARRILFSVDKDIVKEEAYEDPYEFLKVIWSFDFNELIGEAEDAYEHREEENG